MSLVDDYHRKHKERMARLGMKPVTAVKPEPVAKPVEPEILPMSALDEWIARQKQIYQPWFSIVEEIDPPSPRQPRVEDIQKACARYYGVTRNDIVSARKTANVVRPRQVGYYLSKVLTGKSLPEIGRRFGNRDHTTILHSVRKIAALVKIDPELSDEIESIKAELAA